MSGPLVYSGSPLDRAGRERKDATWVKRQLEREDSRFLPFWRLRVLVKAGNPGELGWARREVCEHRGPNGEAVLLGLHDDVAHFAVDVSALEKPEAALGLQGLARFEEVRAAAALLSPAECAITAQGRSCIDWHTRHRFCAVCGGKTTAGQGGLVRECDECDAEHFPRTDPVVIMVVTDGERCLLGRQSGWPLGMFSALAGFVDQGETIEEAVRREVSEETGVPVGRVRYYASQPWPFPSSLMIGCLAQADATDLRVDLDEISEARWFTRPQVAAALTAHDGDSAAHDPADLAIPPRMAIAHHLIRAWSEGEKP